MDTLTREEARDAEAQAWWLAADRLRRTGRADDALLAYRRATDLEPSGGGAYYDFATFLAGRGDLTAALAEACRALTADSAHRKARALRAALLRDLGRPAEAVEEWLRLIVTDSNDAAAYCGLGLSLAALSCEDAAISAFRQAIALDPDRAEAHANLGVALRAQGRHAEALTALGRALEIAPDDVRARLNLALVQLTVGDFAAGWTNYAVRWQVRGAGWDDAPPIGRWSGAPLNGGRVLLSAEQGIGDEAMFAGMLPSFLALGVLCVLSCDRRLMPLFARSFPGLPVVERHRLDGLPDDVVAWLPCGDLPRLLWPDRAPEPAAAYLKADPARTETLRRRYGDGRPLVGIAWHSANPGSGKRRSLPPDVLAGLIAACDVRWVGLQYGAAADDARRNGLDILVDPEIDPLADLDGFAAQVAAMDAVVTIDNSTAHFAGGLGVPTWVLLPFAADWRWQAWRDDSQWYPRLRLIRQERPGDWASPVERAVAQVRRLSLRSEI